MLLVLVCFRGADKKVEKNPAQNICVQLCHFCLHDRNSKLWMLCGTGKTEPPTSVTQCKCEKEIDLTAN